MIIIIKQRRKTRLKKIREPEIIGKKATIHRSSFALPALLLQEKQKGREREKESGESLLLLLFRS
jgi:hypothetical protein